MRWGRGYMKHRSPTFGQFTAWEEFKMDGDLTFARFRQINGERCKRWHDGGVDGWSLTDWSNAAAGEMGECCNAVKKLRRVEDEIANLNEPGRSLTDREAAVRAIGAEIADTITYLDLLAQKLGIRIEHELAAKFNAVSEKYGFPERL
jgi:NTP pyrophosphatase (non-canonical NTP hydrolase)